MARNAKDSQLAEYKDLIHQLNQTITALNEQLKALQQTMEQERCEKALLQEQIDYLTKKLFGTSSEKRTEMKGQLSLFNEAETEAAAAPEPPILVVEKHTRKARSTHEELFRGIPSSEEVITLPEEERICKKCGTPLVPVGKEFVRREFRFTPAKGRVVALYRETYKCASCEQQNGDTPFFKAVIPEALIPESYASASVVAWVMYQKYANAMPLYRQEQDWKQLGVSLKRSTLASWIIDCADRYFRPMYECFHQTLIKRNYLMADETTCQVLQEPGRKAETDSFMWLFRSGEDGLPPIILYHYTETRARFHAAEFLKGFEGYLEVDGYQGYNDLPGVKRCACFAHIRRYFIDAIPKGKEYDYSHPAVQGVQFCSKLFEYERISSLKGHSFEERYQYRLEKEKPVLESFLLWLDQQKPSKGSRLYKAVNHARNRKEFMMTYLEDGHCSLSNNASENAIRPFTVGRKNWLFSATPAGAEASAMVYTMVEMAKANDLNVYRYLVYLLEHRPSKDMEDRELEQLAPWSEPVRKSSIRVVVTESMHHTIIVEMLNWQHRIWDFY